MNIKAQHACRSDGGEEFLIKNSPFLAEHKPDEGKYQFLGEGYYLWDENREMAHYWGKAHYKNKYAVIEMDIELTENNCLDLVGNRKHMLLILNFLTRLKDKGINRENWELSKCIEYLKKLSSKNPNIFPFNIIKSIDYISPKLSQKIFFVQKNNHYTILNPKITLCIIDKKKLSLHTKKIIYFKHQ